MVRVVCLGWKVRRWRLATVAVAVAFHSQNVVENAVFASATVSEIKCSFHPILLLFLSFFVVIREEDGMGMVSWRRR